LIRYIVAFILTIFLALSYWLVSRVPSQSYAIKKTETISSNSNFGLDVSKAKKEVASHQNQQRVEFLGEFLDPERDLGVGIGMEISLGDFKDPDDILDYTPSNSKIVHLGQEKDPETSFKSEIESEVRHIGRYKDPNESDSDQPSSPRHIGEYLDPAKD